MLEFWHSFVVHLEKNEAINHKMKYFNIIMLAIALPLFTACQKDNEEQVSEVSISSLNFIGEQVIPDNATFNGSVVGGLSSIDYANGIYYLISDAPAAPIRYYTAQLTFDQSSFSKVEILSQVELLDKSGNAFANDQADPEAIRLIPSSGNIIWTSEGYVDGRGVNPFIREASANGQFVKEYTIPALFQASTQADQGPRNNGTFEGISRSVDGKGYWVAMELPLIQDGDAPTFGTTTQSPVRISYVDQATGEFGRQFVYELGPVVRSGNFMINGVVEVLAYAENKFLVLERSFATGYSDGGNNVRIYKVDASSATDVSTMNSLKGATYTPATKTLLFDFEDIRAQLSTAGGTDRVVDNIEGIAFGADLPNGNKSLVLVADNNFSAFGQQLNQFVVFEVIP
ncbi:MAG TPA: hypothetical protein DCS93_03550 [Microscillaceae bacterium]|nr:hypothetical protein [Microscillaceae bacterium]